MVSIDIQPVQGIPFTKWPHPGGLASLPPCCVRASKQGGLITMGSWPCSWGETDNRNGFFFEKNKDFFGGDAKRLSIITFIFWGGIHKECKKNQSLYYNCMYNWIYPRTQYSSGIFEGLVRVFATKHI